MMLRLVTLALLLPLPLLACSSGTGDVPSPGCSSVDSTHSLSFAAPMAPGSGDAVQCLERSPTVESTGAPVCLALHATKAAGTCSCPADQGLQPVSAAHQAAIGKFFDPATKTDVVPSCVCEVIALSGDINVAALRSCQNDATMPPVDVAGKPINGYCLVDPLNNPASNDGLVKTCPATERRALRFVGRPAVQQPDDLSVTVVCQTQNCNAPGE